MTRDRSFASAIETGLLVIQDIDELLDAIYKESEDLLVGLPLPLADGSISKIQKRTPLTSTVFVKPPSTLNPWPFFPARRFVHPELSICRRLTLRDLNIDDFSKASVSNLIGEILPASNEAHLSERDQQWVTEFWTNRRGIPLTNMEIRSLEFPLVPTTLQAEYISLSYCGNAAVFAAPDGDDTSEWMHRVISSLGAILVRRSHASHPPALQTAIAEVISPTRSDLSAFKRIIQYWRNKGMTPASFLSSNTPEDICEFADFARDHIGTLRVAEIIRSGRRKRNKRTVYHIEYEDVARQLPIWEARRGGSDIVTYQSADALIRKALPHGVHYEQIKMFLSPNHYFAEYHRELMTIFGDTVMTFSDLLQKYIVLPTRLSMESPTSLASYRYLLEQCRQHLTSTNIALTIKVPNGQGDIVAPNTLYAKSTRFFRVVLEHHPHFFIHPALSELERSLCVLNGIKQAVDFDAFKHCVSVIHSDYTLPEHNARAALAFATYNDSLWRELDTHKDHRWRELDDKQFIPRSPMRRDVGNIALSSSTYAKTFPDVVAPRNILRPQYEAISWTQRVRPNTPLSERLLLADIKLGVPSADEVVEHLRMLVFIAADHPREPTLCSDLKDTYDWLAKHISDCENALLSCQSEKIFLNIDGSPQYHPEWRFASSSELWFNAPDEGSRQRARSFLEPYKELLLCVGAKEIKNAVRPALELTPAEEMLSTMRSSFNRLREQGSFTDVILESSEGERFPAHRLILATSTEHFEDMFRGGWSESQAGTLQTELSADILEHVLDYMYTGFVGEIDDQDDLLELLELADRWNLPPLSDQVENQLIATITIGTYKSVQETAEMYRAEMLLRACKQFQLDNAHALPNDYEETELFAVDNGDVAIFPLPDTL